MTLCAPPAEVLELVHAFLYLLGAIAALFHCYPLMALSYILLAVSFATPACVLLSP